MIKEEELFEGTRVQFPVLAEQQRRFGAVVSTERPWDYLASVYIVGTVDEIQQQIQTRVDMGIEYMMLHTLTPDLEQLDLFAKYIMEPFATATATR